MEPVLRASTVVFGNFSRQFALEELPEGKLKSMWLPYFVLGVPGGARHGAKFRTAV